MNLTSVVMTMEYIPPLALVETAVSLAIYLTALNFILQQDLCMVW